LCTTDSGTPVSSQLRRHSLIAAEIDELADHILDVGS